MPRRRRRPTIKHSDGILPIGAPNYVSFSGAEVDGGFNGESDATVTVPGVLVVLYAKDITESLEHVVMAGGSIVRPTHEFLGGKRFHFHDPNGNELAVWSER